METAPAEPSDDETASVCPADALLRKLWGQWKTHVIYVLGERKACRFGVLRRTIAGISPKVLTQRLRELEADGLVWREQENTIPPKVTYGLTETGCAIHEVLKGFDPIAAEMARSSPADATGKRDSQDRMAANPSAGKTL